MECRCSPTSRRTSRVVPTSRSRTECASYAWWRHRPVDGSCRVKRSRTSPRRPPPRRLRQLRSPAPRLRHARPLYLRHCLSARPRTSSLVKPSVEHRFTTASLPFHSFGNLFLAGLTDLWAASTGRTRVGTSAGGCGAGRAQHHRLSSWWPRWRTGAHRARRDRDSGRLLSIRTAAARSAHPQRPPPRAVRRSSGRADVDGPRHPLQSTVPPLLVAGHPLGVPAANVRHLTLQPSATACETDGYRASDHTLAST